MRALLTCLLLALAAPALADPMPSTVIFPVQRIPLSFSHARHLALPGTGCGTCHEDAARSRRAADLNIPPESACTSCHEIERDQPQKEVAAGEPDAKCTSCHPGWNGAATPPRIVIPTPNLKFSHEVHATRGISCATCHGDMKEVNLATRAQLPKMQLCLGCHDGKQASAACTTCHLAEGPGRIQTRFAEGQLLPSGALRGDAHDLRFRTDHATVAKNDEKYCGSCHTRAYCVDCHNGVAKPLDFHVGDYVAMHPIDARRATTDCGGCHRQQTFCTGCHSRMGAGDDPRTTRFERPVPNADPPTPQERRFHPEGFVVEGDVWSPKSHAFQARRNIRTCASCHREDFCVGCHRMGESNIITHPAGFATSARCDAMAARNGRMCLRCHLDPESARCR